MNNVLRLRFNSSRKQRVMILGSGWAGFTLAKKLSKKIFDVTMVSPRNYFLFTPMLTTTTVGTLEFRNITEPVRKIKDMRFIEGNCTSISSSQNTLSCETIGETKYKFDLHYDVLAIACGAMSNTFGIKGVEKNCYFLKQVSDAMAIRRKITEMFELSCLPNLSDMERSRILTFVIVGAGPANIEFAAELSDFLNRDAVKLYPGFEKYIKIYIIEALDTILPMFSKEMRDYAKNIFESRNFKILTRTCVKDIKKETVILTDGSEIKAGTIIWNTGNKQLPFTESLEFDREKRCGRIIVDDFQRVKIKGKTVENVFSLGDCSSNPGNLLPPTAQVAAQQAKWLAKSLNCSQFESELKPFKYEHKGLLAYMGDKKALADLGKVKLTGFGGWVIWNAAYLSQIHSIKNKIALPVNWALSFFFGRNISRFY